MNSCIHFPHAKYLTNRFKIAIVKNGAKLICFVLRRLSNDFRVLACGTRPDYDHVQ